MRKEKEDIMLKTNRVSLSLALTTEALYLACVFFFYLFPLGTLRFFNTWMHGIDLLKIASDTPVTFCGFISGFVSIFVASYVIGFIYALIYNAINRG